MKRNRAKSIAIAATYRHLLGRLAFLSLFALSFWLIIASHNPASFTHLLAMKITDTLAPIIQVLATPLDTLHDATRKIDHFLTLEAENKQLKTENETLRRWYASGLELKHENENLRALLKFVPTGKSTYISAKVAVDSQSPYSRTLLLGSGSDNGIREDAAVINEKGMVGRIIETGSKTARVLLLTDLNSRIPVISENTREHYIAVGGKGEELALLYMPESSHLKVGETIMTSGDGAVLPPSLPVGIVTRIEKNTAFVKPFVDWYRIELVSVIDFSD